MKKEDGQEIRMLNGRCVMKVLTSLNSEATQNQLIRHFMKRTDQPRELLKEELNLILENGVSEGFIIKSGKNYLLPNQCDEYQTDGEECEADDEELTDEELTDEERQRLEDEIRENELLEIDEEAKKEKEPEYLAACDEIMSEDGKLFHDVLINNIIDLAVEHNENVGRDDRVPGKDLEELRKEFSTKAKKLREKVEAFYIIAYDLYTLKKKIPRYEILNSLRNKINENWNEHEISDQLDRMKDRYKRAMKAIQDHDSAIVCLQFLDFVIFQVKNARFKDWNEDEILLNTYHYNQKFAKKLQAFAIAAFRLVVCDYNYQFDKYYKSRKSSDEDECATPRSILKAHGQIGCAVNVDPTPPEHGRLGSAVSGVPASPTTSKKSVKIFDHKNPTLPQIIDEDTPEGSSMGPPAAQPSRLRGRKVTKYLTKPVEKKPSLPIMGPPPPRSRLDERKSPTPPSIRPKADLPDRLKRRRETYVLPIPPSSIIVPKGESKSSPATCPEPTSMAPPRPVAGLPSRLQRRKGTTHYDPVTKKPL